MVKRKTFIVNPKHQYHASQWEEHDCSAITKGIEIITGIQVCLISSMNINRRENGGMKCFSCQSKASISCFPMWKTRL